MDSTKRKLGLIAEIGLPATKAARTGSRGSVPVVRALPDLPEEIWRRITADIIPSNPFLQRPDDPGPYFPIAAEIYDLHSLAQTSVWMNKIVREVCNSEDHFCFRAHASRMEYEIRKRSGESQRAAIAYYGMDPNGYKRFPSLVTAQIEEPWHWDRLLHDLEAQSSRIQALQLVIRNQEAVDYSRLRNGLSACKNLRALSLTTNAEPNPALIKELGAARGLKSVSLCLPSLQSDLLTVLAMAPSATTLLSVDLNIQQWAPVDFCNLHHVARRFRDLRFLSLRGGVLTHECCSALAKAISDLPLEYLDIGRDGHVAASGLPLLLDAICDHHQINRLGLHKIGDASASADMFSRLNAAKHLREFMYGGEFSKSSLSTPWMLLKAPCGLSALELNACQLEEEQMVAFADTLRGASKLRELTITSQAFTDHGAKRLSQAIQENTGLIHLSLRDCQMNGTPQANSLASAVAKSRSLLALDLRFPSDSSGEHAYAARLFGSAVAKSKTLVHFSVEGAKCATWSHAEKRLHENRLHRVASIRGEEG